MKKILIEIAAAATLLVMSSTAWATSAALQQVLDDITITPTGGSSVDVTTDYLADELDDYWAVGGSGGSISTMIIELAGYAPNTTFGVYDQTDASNFVELFAGSDEAGDQVLLSIMGDGSVIVNFADTLVDFAANSFGFYLDSSLGGSGGLFYSDTTLNADGFDHMMAYQGVGDEIQILPFAPGVWGANEYILAWEDLVGGGDQDYTDMVLIVESVTPVPGPAPLLVFGIGLIGLGISRQRRAKDAA